MFCPSCGAESPIELNYCNRCGANLTVLAPSPQVAPGSLTKPTLIVGLVMLFITLGGFAGVLSTAVDLSSQIGNKDVPMAIIFFGMVTILLIDILLFSLLWKLINATLSSSKVTTKTASAKSPAHLAQPVTARLQPAPSITENTTRFFENYPAPIEEAVPVKKKDR